MRQYKQQGLVHHLDVLAHAFPELDGPISQALRDFSANLWKIAPFVVDNKVRK